MTKYKVGDLVRTRGPGRRLWLVVKNDQAPGHRDRPTRKRPQSDLVLVSGHWYSNAERRFKAAINPAVWNWHQRLAGGVTDAYRYGKQIPLEGRVIGRIRTHYGAQRHLR